MGFLEFKVYPLHLGTRTITLTHEMIQQLYNNLKELRGETDDEAHGMQVALQLLLPSPEKCSRELLTVAQHSIMHLLEF